MRRKNRIICFVLTLLLAVGIMPGMSGTVMRAQAGWVDWGSLFEGSGWYDEEAAGEKEDKEADKKENKKQKGNKKQEAEEEKSEDILDTVEEDGTYTSKEEVAAYLHLFGHLPDNFITKNEAKKLGWINSEGNLDEVAPGKSIGGDRFGNYEGNLPEKKNRTYYECDIDFDGGYRGSKRIIYSNDGLIYYTEDHYNTFELLYED